MMGDVSGVAEIAARFDVGAAEERRGGCALPLPVSMALGVHSFCVRGVVFAPDLK